LKPSVVEGDLLDLRVDAIVNAWNRNVIPWWLLLPQGVSGAIKRRAGYAPFRELARHGPIPLGHAVLTSAGRLSFRGIIHVAGIDMLWRSSPYAIKTSVESAMALAQGAGFTSVGFPLVGAGTGGIGEDGALKIMLTAFDRLSYPIPVTIVRFRATSHTTPRRA